MPRHYAKLDRWETFIPDVDDERKLYADGKPAITMELRHMTLEEINIFTQSARADEGKGSKDFDDYARNVFNENVRSIKEYSIDDKPIVTGADLWDRGEADIIGSVTSALITRKKLDDGLAKKLRSACDTSSVRQKSTESGGAPGATRQSIPTIPEIQPDLMTKCGFPTQKKDASGIANANPTKPLISSGHPEKGDAQTVS